MDDLRGNKRRRYEDGDQDYPEVFLEPIDDPGFNELSDRHVSFDFQTRKRKKTLIVLLSCAIALIICILAYFFISAQKRAAEEAAAQLAAEEALRLQLEQERLEFEALSNSTVFLEGITIEGVDVGGMSLNEARATLTPIVNDHHSAGNLQLTYGEKVFSLDLSKVTGSSNLEDVLAEAYRLGKTGDYLTMKAEVEDVKTKGRSFSLTASYDFSQVLMDIALIAEELNTEPVNAGIKGFDLTTRSIEFDDGVVGVIVQQEELVRIITEALLNDIYTPIAIPALETAPAITRADLEGKYVLRAKATTSFSGSSSNRIYNINKGSDLINGTVLKPGQEFSANDTLGTRTLKNGWRMAGAYVGGAVVEEPGGGVCQLSSTLYNAVVKADLEVVYRRNHSMPVTYISEGLDATINSVGNIIDFQFRNNTTSDILIFGYTEGKNLTFEIYGLPFATSEYDEIKLTSQKVSTLNPSDPTVEIEVAEGTEKPTGGKMSLGETYVAVTRRTGSSWQSYKNYYKNGELVKKEALAASTYKAMAGEIWICPSPTPSATVEPVIPPTSTATPVDPGTPPPDPAPPDGTIIP